MKIIKLTGLRTIPVTAIVIKNKRTNALYYNIKHGTSGKNLWVYSCSLNKVHFNPINESDALELMQDNYILKPIKEDGEISVDGKQNVRYSIGIDNMENHKKDLIVFWEIPNKNYTDVSFATVGLASTLGTGIVGKERDKILYASPAPVLEILGDVTLSWKGTDVNGDEVSQLIIYDYASGTWEIQPIKTTPKDKK